MSLSLPVLFNRLLKNASKASNLPTIDDETQELVAECMKDLKELHTRIIELSMFSPNEVFDDISTRDLVYLTVPYVFSEVRNRLKCLERAERMALLVETEKYTQSFVDLLHRYEIVPKDETVLFDRKTADVADYSKRRELKINQYKKEKELCGRIQALQKRRTQTSTMGDSPSDFDLIESLLPAVTPKGNGEEEEEDSETDEILRGTTLLLLRLLYAKTCTQLQNMDQELQLLRNAPPTFIGGPPQDNQDSRGKGKDPENETWKLDIPLAGGPDGKGPLLDPSGKPLRAFTILPSGAADRAQLQAKVFGPSHRLPTMSIDEYLEIERERGNILTGGGAASAAVPTSSEQLALDSEMDGTVGGELKAEEKRLKDEKWAQYTDTHPKGAGNTMNRG